MSSRKLTVVNKTTVLFIVFALLCAFGATWAVFARLVVPGVIESAYKGESLSVLNGLIASQSQYPVSFYLSRWEQFSNRLLGLYVLLIPLASIAIFVLTRPQIQNFREGCGVAGNLTKEELVVSVGRSRVWLVYAIVTVVVGFSLFDIIKDQEHWPFSPYGMYSELQTEYAVSTLWLVGTTEDGSQRIPLTRPEYIQPFDISRLRWALETISGTANREQRLHEALSDFLVRYERLRHAGLHHGPPLKSVELDRVYWKLDSWARNADQPDRFQPLFEVQAP
jgi:hypothetical protein